MVAKRFDTRLAGLTGALAISVLTFACSAPPEPTSGNNGSEAALQDSDYKSMINDPRTDQLEWKSIDARASGVAYWHVGVASAAIYAESSGALQDTPTRGEYVVATGYDSSDVEVVDVIIPQRRGDVAGQLRPRGNLDVSTQAVADEVQAITRRLPRSSTSGTATGRSQCGGRDFEYRGATDISQHKRCSMPGPTAAAAVGTPDRDIIVVLNAVLDGFATAQAVEHCDNTLRPIDEESEGIPSLETGDRSWNNDCSNVGSRDGYHDLPGEESPGRTRLGLGDEQRDAMKKAQGQHRHALRVGPRGSGEVPHEGGRDVRVLAVHPVEAAEDVEQALEERGLGHRGHAVLDDDGESIVHDEEQEIGLVARVHEHGARRDARAGRDRMRRGCVVADGREEVPRCRADPLARRHAPRAASVVRTYFTYHVRTKCDCTHSNYKREH